MKLRLITPAPAGSFSGNRVTAARWARLLRQLGHRVEISEKYRGEPCDALIALHARKSHGAARLFRKLHPDRPLVVALTGTDLYRDIRRSARARQSLQWAEALVVLQPLAIGALPAALRPKAHVILQSAERPARRIEPPPGEFRACVVGHLRAVKDPFRAAMAVRLLPSDSRIRVVHLGRAMGDRMAQRARKEMARNPRYRWLGELPRSRALSILAGSRLLVLTSRLEGGANVVSEALAAGVPVLSSRIPGSIGILGRDYPGFFLPGDTRSLTRLLERCETDTRFLERIRTHCRRLARRHRPSHERAAWKRLLACLFRRSRGHTHSILPPQRPVGGESAPWCVAREVRHP